MTIDSINAGGNGGSGDRSSATQIVRYTEYTVVLVTTSANNFGVILPSNSEIGDAIEIHNVAPVSNAITVYAPSGQYLSDVLNGLRGSVVRGLFRLTEAGSWRLFAAG